MKYHLQGKFLTYTVPSSTVVHLCSQSFHFGIKSSSDYNKSSSYYNGQSLNTLQQVTFFVYDWVRSYPMKEGVTYMYSHYWNPYSMIDGKWNPVTYLTITQLGHLWFRYWANGGADAGDKGPWHSTVKSQYSELPSPKDGHWVTTLLGYYEILDVSCEFQSWVVIATIRFIKTLNNWII